jgi:hypothetical protein
MKTIYHAYHFNTSKPDDARAYDELVARLTAQGLQVFSAIGKHEDYHNPKLNGEIELDTAHLDANQGNTLAGVRVFDWAERYLSRSMGMNPDIKSGHYLEQTDEMRSIRANTAACGYCGHREPVGQNQFCPKCIGSEYLKPTELHLLRMLPVSAGAFPKRAPLTDEEARKLTPRYEYAQGLGVAARNAEKLSKRRQDIANLVPNAHAKGAWLVENAEIETRAFTYLMDNGWREIENVIYYPHTGKFGFGWRDPLTDAQVSALLDIITEFPYLYEIKQASGIKLTRDA